MVKKEIEDHYHQYGNASAKMAALAAKGLTLGNETSLLCPGCGKSTGLTMTAITHGSDPSRGGYSVDIVMGCALCGEIPAVTPVDIGDSRLVLGICSHGDGGVYFGWYSSNKNSAAPELKQGHRA